jgi:hypothetical protein
MSKEVIKRFVKESQKYLVPLSLLAISLLSVSFRKSEKGFVLTDENNFSKLSEPEQRVARLLLSLGIEIGFEAVNIRLDDPVEVSGKDKKTGESKMKSITTPDFYFNLYEVECYLEIGSRRVNAHKRRQTRVMEKVVDLKKSKRIIYLQLFKDDIELMEEYIETTDDLLSFLYEHEESIYN